VSLLAVEAVRLREYAIHPALAPYVKCIWSLEFVETFALAQPGKDFETYSETRFRRKR